MDAKSLKQKIKEIQELSQNSRKDRLTERLLTTEQQRTTQFRKLVFKEKQRNAKEKQRNTKEKPGSTYAKHT